MTYLRPRLSTPAFRDRDGRVIDYGDRWSGSPPDDTYSVVTHPERFAPLHAVADALIEHLRDTYDVVVEQGEDVVADLLHPVHHDVVKAVRLRPIGPSFASLTFVLTGHPGVHVHAGLLHDFAYPVCSCDACDSTWEHEADRLERQVLAVVNGQYREGISFREGDPWLAYALGSPDGPSSGGFRAHGMSPESVQAAQDVLQNLAGPWSAWPSASKRA
ncbi:DUF6226 family protein [Microbacterium sp. ET2]|uniref:DUF6226 family protein n=1 Tax=Microbacterium albipurpureum TaxID=3050384 RepID=UPI00259CDEDD|nr:DUF6226 family protein [Microbacterium sp. ET2 (Ac-2212)]WJL95419.1 DUF6226 family protein [Microbacterium sp. ET2 (Ac-2212)]